MQEMRRKCIGWILAAAVQAFVCGCSMIAEPTGVPNLPVNEAEILPEEEETSEGSYDEAPSFFKGKLQDNQYINTVLGIRFSPDSKWDFFSEKDRASKNGLNYPESDDEINRLLENDRAFVDLIARHDGTMVSVTVYLPKQIDGTDVMTPEEMIQRTYETALDETSPESLKLQLDSAGVQNTEVSRVYVRILGDDREAIAYKYEQATHQITGMKVLFMRGGYLFEVAALSPQEEKAEEALLIFSMEDETG